ncbi:MAG: hypothetical protein Q8R28_01900, partial [Dehalococcoidia bacterium]|nr:hypothetical protein [Dehalococcoidia bacterium]
QGTVLNYVRRNCKHCLPPIEQYHPEIAQPTDRRAAELPCDEAGRPGPTQNLLTNHLVALEMLTAFQAEMNGQLTWDESFIDLAAPAGEVVRRENRWHKQPLNPHFQRKKARIKARAAAKASNH